jgi:hypothetical protein
VEFRVIWEIEIEADTPTEARAIQLKPGMSATVFDVWARIVGKMHRIDVEEADERLDRDELVVVRTGLRFLQCKRDVPSSTQDLATVMLVFLDRDNMIFSGARGELSGYRK